MSKYTLISFKLCPFVQRSTITLEEKGVPYEIQYVDLNDKPDWFLEISPFGKVPVLRVGETVLFESAVICEFLDETAGDTRLHPKDPLRRAHNRAWIEFSSSLIIDGYLIMIKDDEETVRKQALGVRDKLPLIEKQLTGGPYFNGKDFSLVDAASASALQRLTWAEQVVPDLDMFSHVPKVAAWRDALLERPSVQRSTVSNIHDLFLDYIRGKRSASLTTDPSWLGSKVA